MRTLILSVLLLAGCATAPGGRPMIGIDWRASDVNGVRVAEGTSLTLRLENGTATGNAGCNSFSGRYQTMSKQGIRFTGLTSTEKACAPAVMDQEQRFLSILRAVEGYSSYSDGGLSLISPDGRAIRFRR